MKSTFKKLVALILCAVMIIGIAPGDAISSLLTINASAVYINWTYSGKVCWDNPVTVNFSIDNPGEVQYYLLKIYGNRYTNNPDNSVIYCSSRLKYTTPCNLEDKIYFGPILNFSESGQVPFRFPFRLEAYDSSNSLMWTCGGLDKEDYFDLVSCGKMFPSYDGIPATYGITYIDKDSSGKDIVMWAQDYVGRQVCSGNVQLSTKKPTKSGYTFVGWSTSGSATTAQYQPGDYIYEDHTYELLYAVWSPNTYTVSYDANGGTGAPSSQTKTYGVDLTLRTGQPTRTDYTFLGWSTSSSATTATYSPGGTFTRNANTTLYAVWQQNLPDCTLSYNLNGGSGSFTSQTVKKGNSVTISSSRPTKSGYSFLGWSTSDNATTAQYQPGNSITLNSDTILYAVWSDASKPSASISTTNNVASSQTVTLSMSDNSGLAGYYWGTSSTYSNNNFTSVSGTSRTATATVASAGTYYLTVKDSAGNLSDSKSVTFFKTTLNANGGSVSPSSVVTASGKSFTLPTPTYSGRSFNCWSTTSSAGGITYTGSYSPTASKTLYAQWGTPINDNIYNLGEETYSFRNFRDEHSSGHCFGMSITSSGYYIDTLDTDMININSSQMLFSVSNDGKVRDNICYYQHIQGNFTHRAMVAGSITYDYSGKTTRQCWNECVDYVKTHNFDNKGNLQIQIWQDNKSGHAVNFLYYKNVNGQDRLYAYDNNFPETEVYFYLGTDGKVYEAPYSTYWNNTDDETICLVDMNKYFNAAKNYNSYNYIYASANEVIFEDLIGYPMACGENAMMMYEIPDNISQITVTPLASNATFEYADSEYGFNSIDDDTYGLLNIPTTLDDGNPRPGESPKFDIINAPTQIQIRNFTPVLNVPCRATVKLRAEFENAPEGATVHWFDDGVDSLTSETCTITNSIGTHTIQAKLISKDGEVLAESGIETIVAKSGFFSIIIAFFKALFGLLPVIEQ